MNFPANLSIESWTAWGEKEGYFNSDRSELDLSGIPPMIRRRLSSLSKMALSVALGCIGDDKADFSIFCSRHGELPRTTGLLEELAKNEELSPMAFSQSVHNTVAGLFSIIKKDMSATTSIAGGADTFGYGLLEASIYLKQNPGKKVLVVAFDEPVPDAFGVNNIEPEYGYCVALLLSDENKSPIKIEFLKSIKDSDSTEPLAIRFLKFVLNKPLALEVSTESTDWKWTRND
ncbi:MAG: beta-ketoacyl synthase chain length factor [Gammaproteobacteria bacterium]|nr:beta-ketoacyl synthase chain length factor [Gammaproteobacteria bacterium]MDH5592795.1 beta-ketoacyl synthase chain length factor [Gammaproteobacteria bacterium]